MADQPGAATLAAGQPDRQPPGGREAEHPLAGRRVSLVLATSAGGTGSHLRSLAAGLAADGVLVHVLGPAATGRRFDFAGTGARFTPVEIPSGLRPLAAGRAAMPLSRALAGSDLVHAHGLRAGLLAGLVTDRATPYVVTWHNALAATGAAHRLLERAVAGRADVTLCVSADLAERVRASGGADVRPALVAAPPLPPAGRSRAQVRAGLGAGDRPVLLTVGRLHPQKGHDTLIEAALLLRDRVPAAQPGDPGPLFLAAGDGPLRGALAARIARTGAPVRLLGHRDDIADLLAAADIVVLPSRWEGSPLAAQEALRAGRPFVGTAAGGVAALVGDGGVLVPAGDPAALADALARLLTDPAHAQALAERARSAARRLPTERAMLAQVRALYAELLGVVA